MVASLGTKRELQKKIIIIIIITIRGQTLANEKDYKGPILRRSNSKNKIPSGCGGACCLGGRCPNTGEVEPGDGCSVLATLCVGQGVT